MAATSLERDVGWVEVSVGGHAINISHRLFTTLAQQYSAVNDQSTNCIPHLPILCLANARDTYTCLNTHIIFLTLKCTLTFPPCLHRAAQENSPNENSDCNKGLAASHQSEGTTWAAVLNLTGLQVSWNTVLLLQRPSCSLTHPAMAVPLSVGTATPHPGEASFHGTA